MEDNQDQIIQEEDVLEDRREMEDEILEMTEVAVEEEDVMTEAE